MGPMSIDSRVPDEVTRAQALMRRHEDIGLLITTPGQNRTGQFLATWDGGVAHKPTLGELNDEVAADLGDDDDGIGPAREVRKTASNPGWARGGSISGA